MSIVEASAVSDSQPDIDPYSYSRTNHDNKVDGVRTQYYNAEAGLESIIVTLGNSRVMLPSEYQSAFTHYPGLAQAAKLGYWPW